jgi:hypothetical protein
VVAPECLSFVGASRHHRQVEADLGPALAAELASQGADLALLVPY